MTDHYTPGAPEIREYEIAMGAAGVTHQQLIAKMLANNAAPGSPGSAPGNSSPGNSSPGSPGNDERGDCGVLERGATAPKIAADPTLVTDLGQFQVNEAIQRAQQALSKENAALSGRFIVGSFSPSPRISTE